MGFNSTRRYRDDKNNDVALLVIGVTVVVLILLWAMGVIG